MFEEGIARWKGRVALVTGASSGIGDAIARRLARCGMKGAIVARRAERLARLQTAIELGGGEALPIVANLRDEADIRRLFAELRAAWGRLDLLVNNAGLGREGRLETADPADWREMLEVNVLALSLCIREALADMKDKTEAQIINLSSLAGHRVPPGRDVAYYAATKHAVRALTDGLREEMVRNQRSVRVGMISPGLVETEFHGNSLRDEGRGRAMYQRFKVLEPADIADAVAYMLAVPPHVQIHDIVLRPLAQPL